MIIFYLIILIFTSGILCEKEFPLIGVLEGEVSSENFTYYKIYHLGNILLVLHTIEGDADIYVSERSILPTYNPDLYDLHSATCGVDSIEIPYSFKRPIAVGIYGHTAYKLSKYTLEGYLLPPSENTQLDMNNNYSNAYEENEESKIFTENKPVKKTKDTKRKHESISSKAGIWALLEIIEMIFL